ncbi:MAG TPA: hypothetical protein VMZ03_13520 [Chitinophagaceae bacterium]|nr:hypothetical protein [Chitinophagaceae bacterium]
MRTGINIILTLVVGATLLACSRGGSGAGQFDGGGAGGHVSAPSDSIPPVLIVSTPVPDQVYSSGAIINVSGTISDNNGLYRGSIRITNDANGALLKEQLYEIHGLTSYNFNINQVVTVGALTNYTVTVWFEDHNYNAASKAVRIKVNP